MASLQIEHGSPEWHEVRRANVGSSESAALLGMGFQTPFQIWAEKNGSLYSEDLSANERVVIGAAVEAGIAEAARQLYNVTLRKVRRYLTHESVEGMGASLDYEELTEDAGWVPAELKNVDWSVFKNEWEEDEEFGFIPPEKYLIQVQHQLSVTGKPYARMYVLVGGNALHRITIPRSDRLIKVIEQAVAQFWDSIRKNQPPPVDYTEDRESLMRVYTAIGRKGEVDLTTDIELAALIEEYATVKAGADAAANELERVKVELFQRIKDYESVRVAGAKISCKLVDAKPERQVTYKATPARREMRVYLSKELKNVG